MHRRVSASWVFSSQRDFNFVYYHLPLVDLIYRPADALLWVAKPIRYCGFHCRRRVSGICATKSITASRDLKKDEIVQIPRGVHRCITLLTPVCLFIIEIHLESSSSHLEFPLIQTLRFRVLYRALFSITHITTRPGRSLRPLAKTKKSRKTAVKEEEQERKDVLARVEAEEGEKRIDQCGIVLADTSLWYRKSV